MRFIVFIFFLAVCLNSSAQTRLYTERISIRYKSISLTSKNLQQIRNAWEHLPVNSSLELMLVSKKEIKKLSPDKLVTISKARADAIKVFLTTQKLVNINDIELNTHSFTDTEELHGTDASFKRRVRDPYKVYSLVLSKEVPNCFDYTNAERKALASKSPAVFTINTSQDAMITGPEGVIVLIPAHSFILPGGKQTADVTIKLWEFLTMDDIVMAGLYTTSAGRLLETGGMIYINASCEGNCLKLLRSSKIIVKFPVFEKLEDMQLFKGMPQPEIIDWKSTVAPEAKKEPPVLPSFDEATQFDGAGDSANMSYYVLEASGLGWINCDRFSEVQEKTDVAYTFVKGFKGEAGLIFRDINSIMPGEFLPFSSNNIKFYDVPKGMDAVLLIYGFSADKKKVYYATQKVVLGDPLKETMKLSEVTLAEFKEVLKTIRY